MPRRLTGHHVLVGSVALFIAVFGFLTWRQHARYGTYGYDMGIDDQALWLLSRFKSPFMTVRGLHYFGHHFNPITLLFVPGYWLGGGPQMLSAVQAVALGLGAVPVYLLARDKTDEWLALVPAAAYLLFPAVQWISWWHFHPEALAIAPLLFAYWFWTRGQLRNFIICAVIALLCKEDVALVLAALGVVMVVRGDRRWGVRTILVSVAWFVVSTEFLIPAFNDGRPAFYTELFPGLGSSVPEILSNAIRHPSRVYEAFLAPQDRTYFWKLLAPLGGLPFLAPLALVTGAPQAVAVATSAARLTADIHFHYSSLMIPGIFIAVVEAFAWIAKRKGWWRVGVAGYLVVTSGLANLAWSPSPVSAEYDDVWVAASPRHAVIKRAMGLVAPKDGVAATYNLIPHLTHRVHAYQFPNPFQVYLWGINDQDPPSPNAADVVVIDTTLNREFEPVFKALVAPGGTFRIVFAEQGIVVARRVRPQ